MKVFSTSSLAAMVALAVIGKSSAQGGDEELEKLGYCYADPSCEGELLIEGIVSFNDCICQEGPCFLVEEEAAPAPLNGRSRALLTVTQRTTYEILVVVSKFPPFIKVRILCCTEELTSPARECIQFEIEANCQADIIDDPHIKQLAGGWFDYQGECDLVFAHVPDFGDTGLDVHARTKIRYDYSYIETAALRIGSHVFEVAGFGQYFLNGVYSAQLEDATISGYPISYKTDSLKRHSFEITLGGGAAIVFGTMKDFVSVRIISGEDGWQRNWFGNSTGLIGSLSNGNMVARNGTVIVDPNEMGQEWQVRESEPKLFINQDRHPQYPEKCLLPDLSAKDHRRLGGLAISLEAATLACQERSPEEKDFCIYDVLATGDLELAEAGVY